jgi:hypothetical protein
MKNHCASCGRPLKLIVSVVSFGAPPKRVSVCKSPVCKLYMQRQEEEG